MINNYFDFLKNINKNIEYTVKYEWLKYNECPSPYKENYKEEWFQKESHLKKMVTNYYGINNGKKYNIELVYENLILFSDILINEHRLRRIKIFQKDKQEYICELKWRHSQPMGIYNSDTHVVSGDLSFKDIEKIVKENFVEYWGENNTKNWVKVSGYDDDFSRPWEEGF